MKLHSLNLNMYWIFQNSWECPPEMPDHKCPILEEEITKYSLYFLSQKKSTWNLIVCRGDIRVLMVNVLEFSSHEASEFAWRKLTREKIWSFRIYCLVQIHTCPLNCYNKCFWFSKGLRNKIISCKGNSSSGWLSDCVCLEWFFPCDRVPQRVFLVSYVWLFVVFNLFDYLLITWT